MASSLSEDPGRGGQAVTVLGTPLSFNAFREEAVRLLEAAGWRRAGHEPPRSPFAEDAEMDFWPVGHDTPRLVKDGWALTLGGSDALSQGPNQVILYFDYQRGVEEPRAASGGLLDLFPQLRLPRDAQLGFRGVSWRPDVDGTATFTAASTTAQLADSLVGQLEGRDGGCANASSGSGPLSSRWGLRTAGGGTTPASWC